MASGQKIQHSSSADQSTSASALLSSAVKALFIKENSCPPALASELGGKEAAAAVAGSGAGVDSETKDARHQNWL